MARLVPLRSPGPAGSPGRFDRFEEAPTPARAMTEPDEPTTRTSARTSSRWRTASLRSTSAGSPRATPAGALRSESCAVLVRATSPL